MVWRLFAAAYITAIWIADIITQHDGTEDYYYIYLTHWTFFLESVYFVLAAALTRRGPSKSSAVANPPYDDGNPDHERTKSLCCRDGLATAVWVFQDGVYPAALAVTILYWVLLFDGSTSFFDVNKHAVNFLLVVVDCFFSTFPVRVLHMWVSMTYAFIYLFWTVINYWANVGDEDGDRYVYSVLDWSDPSSALALSAEVVFILLPILQCVMHLVHALGNCLRKDEPTDGVEMTQQSMHQRPIQLT